MFKLTDVHVVKKEQNYVHVVNEWLTIESTYLISPWSFWYIEYFMATEIDPALKKLDV